MTACESPEPSTRNVRLIRRNNIPTQLWNGCNAGDLEVTARQAERLSWLRSCRIGKVNFDHLRRPSLDLRVVRRARTATAILTRTVLALRAPSAVRPYRAVRSRNKTGRSFQVPSLGIRSSGPAGMEPRREAKAEQAPRATDGLAVSADVVAPLGSHIIERRGLSESAV